MPTLQQKIEKRRLMRAIYTLMLRANGADDMIACWRIRRDYHDDATITSYSRPATNPTEVRRPTTRCRHAAMILCRRRAMLAPDGAPLLFFSRLSDERERDCCRYALLICCAIVAATIFSFFHFHYAFALHHHFALSSLFSCH